MIRIINEWCQKKEEQRGADRAARAASFCHVDPDVRIRIHGVLQREACVAYGRGNKLLEAGLPLVTCYSIRRRPSGTTPGSPGPTHPRVSSIGKSLLIAIVATIAPLFRGNSSAHPRKIRAHHYVDGKILHDACTLRVMRKASQLQDKRLLPLWQASH